MALQCIKRTYKSNGAVEYAIVLTDREFGPMVLSDHPYYVQELCNIEEVAEANRLVALATGGAAAINLDRGDVYAATVAALESMGVENTLSQLPTVVIYDDALVGLTQREKEALFFHEVGHLKFKHLELGIALDGHFLVSPLLEIEADAFAVSMGYGREMASALAKVITGKIDCTREEIIDAFEANDVFGARAMALQEYFKKAF